MWNKIKKVELINLIETIIDVLLGEYGTDKKKQITELFWKRYELKLPHYANIEIYYIGKGWEINIREFGYDKPDNIYSIELLEYTYKCVGFIPKSIERYEGIWFRQNHAHIFNEIHIRNRYSNNADLEISLKKDIDKEDLFNLSLMSPIHITEEEFNLCASVYRHLKTKPIDHIVNIYRATQDDN